jgi:hypothetical protein
LEIACFSPCPQRVVFSQNLASLDDFPAHLVTGEGSV